MPEQEERQWPWLVAMGLVGCIVTIVVLVNLSNRPQPPLPTDNFPTVNVGQ